MDWYAVFVETGKEEYVKKWFDFYFKKETFRSLIPRRKLSEKKAGKTIHVLKKLFPGYIFINTEMDTGKYRMIKSIPSLYQILNTGTYYSAIDHEEISIILKLLRGDDIIDYSKVFVENSRVIVKDGPLYGMEGLIKRVNKHTNRAKVQINLLGEPRTVDIGVEILYSMDSG